MKLGRIVALLLSLVASRCASAAEPVVLVVDEAVLRVHDGGVVEVGPGLYLDREASLTAAAAVRDCAEPQIAPAPAPAPAAAVGWALVVGLALGLVGGATVAVAVTR
jgi:hypothetical protein